MSALVFLDLETTGLNPRGDVIWEFAAIRREEDGAETRHHAFVDHDPWVVQFMPDQFRLDLDARYDKVQSIGQGEFRRLLQNVLAGKPRIVGACPWFDEGFIEAIVERTWSHRLIDVETLAAGKVGRLMNGLSDAAGAFGIINPGAHTAMGDAQTAMRIYDAVMGGAA